MRGRVRLWVARVAAPAALLLAVTVAVLLVRDALESADGARTATAQTTVATTTRPATAPTRPRQRPRGRTTTAPAARFYRVRSGDTLETIAEQYGTTVEELLTLNPNVDPVELSIGQRIRVQ